MVSALDPRKSFISHVLDRRQCVEREKGVFLKDLRVVRGRPLERMVAVDFTLLAFMSQLDNGIRMPKYRGGREDKELRTVTEFLMTLGSAGDVRPLVKKFAGIERVLRIFSKEEKREKRKKESSEPEVGVEYE